MTKKTTPLVLFAASKAQKRYFDALSLAIPDKISQVVWYKDLSIWTTSRLSRLVVEQVITDPIDMLIKRKQGLPAYQHLRAWQWRIYRYWLTIRASWLAQEYANWLSQESAEWIGVWNGKKFRQAILVNVAKAMGKSVLFFETGPIPSYSMIDSQGVNAHSSVPKSIAFYENYRLTHPQAERILPSTTTTIQQVFIPFQVVEDSNIYMHSPWLANMFQLFEQVKQLAHLYPNIHFLLKTHPACQLNYAPLVNQCLPNMYFISGQSTSDLVQTVDAVITINSTVGIEALMQNKPVIVLGEALYNFFPLTLQGNHQQALQQAFAQLHAGWRPSSSLITAFIHYLQEEYAVKGDAMKSPSSEHFVSVKQKLAQLL